MSEINSVRLSPQELEATLSSLPEKLLSSDVLIAKLQRQADELKESVDFAETNASLNANPDGKNEETRKLQRAKAIYADPEVKQAKAQLAEAQDTLAVEQAQNKELSRQFAALCHVAIYRAAQLELAAKGAMLK